jgi:dienelactone hydrolase
MSNFRNRIRHFAIAALLVGGLSCSGCAFFYAQRDYAKVFAAQKSETADVQRELLRTSELSQTEDVTLRGADGRTVVVRLRTPLQDGKFQAVMLAVGLETGKRVVDMLEDRDDMVVAALDYPNGVRWDTPSKLKLIRDMRRTSMKAVPALLAALDALYAEPKVDTNRVVLVGVSYGSYFALAAGAIDKRVSKVMLLQGGGEISRVVAANVGALGVPLPPKLVGMFAEIYFLPLQPERFAAKISPRPLVVIASRDDEGFPPESIESVFARAREPKRLVWHDMPHVQPGVAELIAELTRVALRELTADERAD